ncbi:MAG: hypothetical protein ACKVP2_01430 [Burkholderiales bacterium]
MAEARTAVMRLRIVTVPELDSHFGRHANCPRQSGMFANERRILLQEFANTLRSRRKQQSCLGSIASESAHAMAPIHMA